MKEICSWCQKEVTNNPFFAVTVYSRRFLGLLRHGKIFYFHNRGEVMLWLQHGQRTRSPVEAS
jgi:hypothetical protein